MFLRKHLCWSLLLSLEARNFFKRRLQHKCFSKNIAKFLRTPILKKIGERLPSHFYYFHYVCVRFTSFITPLSMGGRTQPLSFECPINQADLHTGCPYYHLTKQRKSVLIQMPSAKISKAFHQHGIAEKTKMTALIWPIGQHTCNEIQ